MLRLSARTRLVVAALVASALVAAACAKVNMRGDLHVAAATAHVFVDDPDASIVDRRAIPQDVSTLQKRADLYAGLMVTTPVLDAIGKRAGIPGDEISGVVRATANVPIPLTQPGSEERASQIQDSRAPYRLDLQAEPGEPVLTIYAEAPSFAEAQRLADSSILGLQDYLRGLAQQQRFPLSELPQLRELGDARGGVVNTRAPFVIGGLTFFVVFALTFAGLMGVITLRNRWGVAKTTRPAPDPVDERPGVGDWPRTTRVLPWTLAGFMAMIWLTPFDKIQLAVHMPIDLKLDRLLLPWVVAIWLLAFAAGGKAAPRLRLSGVHLAVGAFVACAFLSVVLDARYLNQTGELDLALKKLPLLVSYVSLFVIVASSVRRSEVPAFMTYTLVLAVICGIGIIIEYRLHENLFNVWSQKLFPPGVFQFVADGNGLGVDSLGRRWIVGPAGFGVETIGMLAMAMPIAVVRLLGAPNRTRKVLYGLAIVVLFAGMFATQRKSALLAPVAVILTLAYFRRRELLSLAPLGLVMAVMVAALSPGAVHGVISQFTRADRSHVATVSDRTSDYDAIRPDLWTHLLLGRGFGTYAPDTYRILDSEILNRIVETGVLGLAAFVMICLSVVLAARKTVSARDPSAAPYALCGTAAAVCFLVLATLFDELGYPHGTYVFLYLAGLVVVVVAPHAAHDPPPRETRAAGVSRTPRWRSPVVGVVRRRMIRAR
jgi:hypothetical protein